MPIPWIIISIAVLIGVLAILAVYFRRKKKTPPDYYAFYVMGLIWLPIGIPLENYALSAMGLIFMLVGILNKDKWKQNRRDWSKMSKQERKVMSILLISLGVLLLFGILFFILVEKGIL